MKLSIFVPLATFLAFFAVAETTDDSPSRCLNQCLNEAAAVAGCASQWDTACTCPSPAFKDTLGYCLKAACTDADVAAAGSLHEERCGTKPDTED
ncbi:hypothetical protein N7540_003658 [Penicillium herquei]|nr:hypothetical protein N7540_003658 [Penicillium herquei]